MLIFLSAYFIFYSDFDLIVTRILCFPQQGPQGFTGPPGEPGEAGAAVSVQKQFK